MVELKQAELKQINGGKATWGAIGVIVSIIGTIIAGIVDGYFRPLTCNK